MVEPKLNPVAGAAAVVVAVPKPGAVRAAKKKTKKDNKTADICFYMIFAYLIFGIYTQYKSNQLNNI